MEKILLTQTNFNKLRDEVKKAKSENKEIIFTSNDDELNRKVLEKLPVNILLVNQSGRKDSQKQRNSGLNQVLVKAAKKNAIKIGINFDEIVNSKSSKEKSEILARVKQNIKLCNKNKVGMEFISSKEKSRDNYDLKALGLVLKMPTWMTKEI